MKVRRPQAAEPGHRAPAPPQHATEAAIEKALSRYILLACGHSTDFDVDAVYRIAGIACPRDKFFCEKCGKWVKPKPRAKRDPLPSEPLF
jgi:hypothetical protein